MLSILAIIFSLLLMVYLIWKKVSIVIAAPICAGILAILSGLNVFNALTADYMKSFGNYVISYWPLFFLSATFAKAMELCGASNDVANMLSEKIGSKHAMMIIIVTSLVLTYGGVSCFVLAFAVYPIALVLWQNADLPRHLIPGAIAAGAFTAPNLLPGSPALVNVLPIQFLGTSATCAPLLAMIDSAVIFGLAVLYMLWQEKLARKRGEHFVADEKIMKMMEAAKARERGNGFKALIPMALVVGLLFAQVNVLISMIIGILCVTVLYWKKIADKLNILNGGIGDSMIAIVNTSAAVGFGGVAAVTAGYQALVNLAINFSGPPLFSFGIATALLAGACGSGSGGLGLALSTLGDKYIAMGIDPAVLHKVASAACITLDSLPHNGVMVTLLAVCGLTHKEAYRHIGMITVVIATVTMFVSIFFGTILY